MRSVAPVLLILLVVASVGRCVLMTPTELAAKLRNLDVSDWDIPTIVCIAHNASNLKTDYVSTRNDIGYTYYGIFGIPDKLFNHKPCSHMTKELALDDSIDDDVQCLLKTTRDGGYLVGSRSSNLGVFTPHEIDLTKCFNWWESLPPFIPKTEPPSSTTRTVLNRTETVGETAQLTREVRTDCSAGVTTNLLLLVLDLTLMGICAVGYLILKQLRVNQFVMKFNDQPLI